MDRIQIKIIRTSDSSKFLIGEDSDWKVMDGGLDGFGDINNTISYTDNAIADGGIVTNTHLTKVDRTIKFAYCVLGDSSLARKKAMAFFNVKDTFKVYVTYGDTNVWALGYVYKIACDMTTSVSDRCEMAVTFLFANPYWRSVDDFGQNIASNTGMTAFPFLCAEKTGIITSVASGESPLTLEGSNASNIKSIEIDADAPTRNKNLLVPTLATTTTNGVTCTNNGDGTYTLNGTATANTTFTLGLPFVQAGTYKIVGVPSGGDYSTTFGYYIEGTIQKGVGYDGATLTYSADTTITIQIMVRSGYACSNLVYKPMLTTDTSATYSDYVQAGVDSLGDYGLVDLGTLTYGKATAGFYCKTSIPALKKSAVVFCPKYKYSKNVYESGCIGVDKSTMWIGDTTYTDADAFKASLSGIYMAYELAEGSSPSEYAIPVVSTDGETTKNVLVPMDAPLYGGSITNAKITRTWCRVDLGTLTWTLHGSIANWFYAPMTGFGSNDCVCVNYETYSDAPASVTDRHIMADYANNRIIIRDTSYSTASALKTALSGVYLYYELATSTSESVSEEQAEALKSIPTFDGYTILTIENADNIVAEYKIGGYESDLKIPVGCTGGVFNFAQKVILYNDGDVPTYCRAIITADDDVVNPKLIINGDYVRIIDTITAEDEIVIDFSAIPPTLKKNGVNFLGHCDRTSNFNLQILKGDNEVEYDADDGSNHLNIAIYYNKLYGGI